MLSQAAGHGIRFATVWQSLAQLKERHGVAADTVLANSTAKVFMGPISDETTRRYLQGMLSTPRREPEERSPQATSGALQQLERGRALLFSADRLPAVADLRPYWSRR
jgi:type IV secretion system protein VirD4